MRKAYPGVGLWPNHRHRVLSADFDSTDHLNRGGNLTGIADAKSGIFSCWVRFDGGDGAAQALLFGSEGGGNVDGVSFYRDTDNKLYIQDNTGSAASFGLVSSGTIVSGAAWRHILAAWNGATGAKHLYLDGVDALDAGGSAANNVDTEYTDCVNWRVGDDTFGEYLNGCLAEVYFAPGQYLDLSIAGNRAKFRMANNQPAALGATGASPTGVAPLVFQSLRPGDAVAAFATNRGTGGNFTVSGTLTLGSNSPSD